MDSGVKTYLYSIPQQISSALRRVTGHDRQSSGPAINPCFWNMDFCEFLFLYGFRRWTQA